MSEGVPFWPRNPEHAPRVLSVAELNRVARFSLEDRFPDLWVEGELVDVSRPASGHVYFTLCDASSQVRGVMYRNDALRARAKMNDGARVRLRCALTLYEARGVFQIVARVALPAGEGDRAAEIAKLRQKLAAEGLFDPLRKRALPRVPKMIGVVTSRDGAALHDIIRVAEGRMPVRILLAHCQVQGADAVHSILRALTMIARVPWVEVLIIARGGGASEDLSAFDDERVVRAVAAFPVPTISGVGHQVDISLVDDVADIRAATPSNAAELAVPERRALSLELENGERALVRALDQRLAKDRLRIERAMRALSDPRRRLASPRSTLQQAETSMVRSMRRVLEAHRRTLEGHRASIGALEPRTRLHRDREALRASADKLERALRRHLVDERAVLERLEQKLLRLGQTIVEARRATFGRAVASLDALSPLGILARGYSIVLKDGRAVTEASSLEVGDAIELRLHRGRAQARIETKTEREPA